MKKMRDMEHNQLRPILYLNHWDYKQHELVKIIIKGDKASIEATLRSDPSIRYSKQYHCSYFIKSKANLDLFYSRYAECASINDWYLNRKKTNINIKPAMATNTSQRINMELKRAADKPIIRLFPIHEEVHKDCILLKYKYSRTLNSVLRNIDSLEWSKKHSSFVMSRNIQNIDRLILCMQGKAKIHLSKELKVRNPETLELLLSQVYDQTDMVKCPSAYIAKMLALNYSKNTIAGYFNHFLAFVNYFKSHDINNLEKADIEDYVNQKSQNQSVSSSYIHMCISAINPVGYN